jgi:hypothetical protein
MNPKKVISAVLLAFVVASVAYLVTGYAGRAPAEAPEAPGEDAKGADAQVVAYYFHGTARCRTCLAIENTARDTLMRELASEFESGAIQWRAVDFEQPENAHFAQEFELTGASLVLVQQAGGRTERWDNLERVWELIGDDAGFNAYVLDEARGYLNES